MVIYISKSSTFSPVISSLIGPLNYLLFFNGYGFHHQGVVPVHRGAEDRLYLHLDDELVRVYNEGVSDDKVLAQAL